MKKEDFAMTERYDVFISYKSEEFRTADRVRKTLEQNGITCWIAPDCIAPGRDYAEEIQNVIPNCRFFVLLLSKKAQQSIYVRCELDEAVAAKKKPIPFIIEECEPEGAFRFLTRTSQQIRAYENMDAALENLAEYIRRELDNKEPRPISPSSPPAPALPKKPAFRRFGWILGVIAAVLLIGCAAAWIAFSSVGEDSAAILFHANGGEGTMPAQTFVIGEPQKLSPNQFTREGYRFLGWSQDSAATEPDYADEELVRIPSASSGTAAFYAVWEKIEETEAWDTVTFYFHANGGDGEMPPQTFVVGEVQRLTANRFTREGYRFLGWSQDSAATDPAYADEEQIRVTSAPVAQGTLYAVWEKTEE